MDTFTEAELAAIVVAIVLARKTVRAKGTVQSPQIFDVIENKIISVFDGEQSRFDDAVLEAVGSLDYLN